MISVSNIAWDVSLDDAVADLLVRKGASAVDIAPPKYFSVPKEATAGDIEKVKSYWASKGLEPIGMQALLFGTDGLNVFGSAAVQQELLDHLAHICRIGDGLGARKLVFGSPRNRDRSGLTDVEADTISRNFFNQLGDIAKQHNVVICLEPNPVCYNANFMTTSLEAAKVVEAIDHSNIRMQLDVGAMCINEEDAEKTISAVAPFVHHIHISEPQLAPLNAKNPYHIDAAKEIKRHLAETPLTVEMLTTDPKKSLTEIGLALDLMNEIYLER